VATQVPHGLIVATPARLGPYQIVRCIGSGGMGTVYEALDERGARVALKTISAMAPGALFRFKQEYRSLADLGHTNLATLHELMAVDDTWFFTMELVDGVNLLEYVWGGNTPQPGAELPAAAEARLRSALRQLVAGVETLHAASLLHLDLKPANVLVDRSGRVVILDFGLVQSLDRAIDAAGGDDALAGTPMYVSPEQVLGAAPGPASDWYAVGVILFQALTGVAPFEGNAVGVMIARTLKPAPDPGSLQPALPGDLTALCSTLLEREPVARAGAREILAVCDDAPGPARTGASPKAARAPLIGRDREFGELHRLCEAGEPAVPLCVSVAGPSGIGKTALVGALLARFEAEASALVLRGRCYERESVPFKGFDAIVDALCRTLTALPTELQRTILDEDIHHTARIFSVVKDLAVLDQIRAPADRLEPQELRTRAFLGLKRALRRLAALRRVVLFIDDLQWADADSAHLLRELLSAPDPPRVLVVVAYRDDEATDSPFLAELRTPRAGGAGFHERSLAIGPLGRDDAEQLARVCLEAGDNDAPTPERIAAVAREAGGLPFFIEAMARYTAVAPAGELGATPTPSLARLIDGHLRELPSAARRMLEVVAVATGPIEQAMALTVAALDTDDSTVLARLRAARLVRTRGVRGRELVEPYHDRIRQGVAASLAAPALAEVHRQLVTALEADPRAPAEALAYHLHGAGEQVRAAEHAERAAHQAVAALAFERAAEQFANALGWGDPDPDAARRLRIARAEALTNAGRCGAAAQVYLEAARGAEHFAGRELRGRAAEAFLYGGHVDEGLRVSRELLDDVGLALPGSPRRVLLGIAGRVAYLRLRGTRLAASTARAPSAEDLFRVDLCWSLGKGLGNVLPLAGSYFMVQALTRALGLADPLRAARSLAFVGGTMLGGTPVGDHYLERAEQIGRDRRDPYLIGLPLIMRGLTHVMHTAHWQTALDLAHRGLDTLRASSLGTSFEQTLGVSITFKALEEIGEIGELAQRAAAWGSEAVERGDRFAEVIAGQLAVLALISRGDIARARMQDRHVIARWQSEGYSAQHFYSVVLRIYCDRYEADVDAAWDLLHAELPHLARGYFLKIPLCRVAIHFLQACLQTDRAWARPDEREALLRAATRLAGQLARERRVDGAVHAKLIAAGIAAVRGERDRAIALLESSHTEYRRIDLRLRAACAARRLGELTGDAARIASADAEIERLGIAEPARWVDAYVPRFAPITARRDAR